MAPWSGSLLRGAPLPFLPARLALFICTQGGLLLGEGLRLQQRRRGAAHSKCLYGEAVALHSDFGRKRTLRREFVVFFSIVVRMFYLSIFTAVRNRDSTNSTKKNDVYIMLTPLPS